MNNRMTKNEMIQWLKLCGWEVKKTAGGFVATKGLQRLIAGSNCRIFFYNDDAREVGKTWYSWNSTRKNLEIERKSR